VLSAVPRSGSARRAPALAALEALSFFMADMQAGVGPFLGVFLVAHGWQSGRIGMVMTLGGVAGMLMTTPAGSLLDATRRKRLYVVVPGVFTVAASAMLLLSQRFWLVAASQVATAVAGAAIGPAVVGITLGMVRKEGFDRQNGRNQAFNHAGNALGAGVSGLLGWRLGLPAVFWLAALFGVLSIGSVLLIPEEAIDDDAARGLDDGSDGPGAVGGLRGLLESKPLLVMAASLACFHLGNGAMLPLFGMAVAARSEGDAAGTVDDHRGRAGRHGPGVPRRRPWKPVRRIPPGRSRPIESSAFAAPLRGGGRRRGR
jgi:MFS family permease